MKVAVASGKGGTGKTTVATNLAWFLGEQGIAVRYVDGDVEEPNGHLFLHPKLQESFPASIPVPVIDASKCIACGECVRFCEFKALVRLGRTVMVFPELCHGCGGCTLVCPQQAITEQSRETGVVESGLAGSVFFTRGLLTVGEAMSPPVIRKVLQQEGNEIVTIIDAPPGTTCPVIAAIQDADFVVLVTEPTPFGLNDLGLALSMVRELGLPHGVIINRFEAGCPDADRFCSERNVDILARIPDDRCIAEAYSRGDMIISVVKGLREQFGALWKAIEGKPAYE